LFWRIFSSFVKIAILLLVLLILTGIVYEFTGRRQDQRRFPRQGQLVDIGGRGLNLNCTGQGSPTVILDSGLGVPAIGWKAVQSEVERFTRVCSYDRASVGWSEAGPLPRTSLQIVKELHTLLHNAGVPPPYVMVGHSLGGFNVRVYNGEYPDEVAGVVLVDASHEEAEERAPASMNENAEKQKAQMKQLRRIAPFLTPIGIGRLLLKRAWGEKILPPGFQSELAYLQLESKQLEAMINELDSFSEDAKEVRRSGTLGDKPLVVVTAGREPVAAEVPPGMSKKDLDEYHRIWVSDLQVRLIRLSTRGKQIIVSDSGHMIPMEKPERVVGAIREVCNAVIGK
jgi:pimeloyl-ACP methyl ester carboxylesterase